MQRKQQWMKRTGSVMLVLSLLVSACGKGEPDSAAQETPNQNQMEVTEENDVQQEPVEEPELVYPYTAPLTGKGLDEELTTRPISIMVENSPAARPQSGLHQADLVYEVLAEGEITRFIATYQSEEAEIIGPVRSIRPYFVELADSLDSVIVHAGWSQEAMNEMVKRGVNHLDAVYGDHPYYWRSQDRRAPHNLYTKTEQILEGAEDRGFRKEWEQVAATYRDAQDTSQGSPATRVNMDYIAGYEVGYTYNEELEVYERIMAGKPHVDRETGTRLKAHNLLIVRAPHRITDQVGRREVDVMGPGEGYMLQQGQMKEITWENRGGMIRAYENGVEVPWIPGKTWIQIVPMASNVVIN
ncbi:DUF3048 domain-containing protein [Marinicrinis sediminis]|uniref:DUF3048 domain-containing protein n=1 Tax=Marinicrinis sediminis TaxID=1652465 RepID=A0ABW5R9Z5_9BACL